MFEKHGIFTEAEVRSRCEIMLENYSKVINIEALTMIDICLLYTSDRNGRFTAKPKHDNHAAGLILA